MTDFESLSFPAGKVGPFSARCIFKEHKKIREFSAFEALKQMRMMIPATTIVVKAEHEFLAYDSVVSALMKSHSLKNYR